MKSINLAVAFCITIHVLLGQEIEKFCAKGNSTVLTSKVSSKMSVLSTLAELQYDSLTGAVYEIHKVHNGHLSQITHYNKNLELVKVVSKKDLFGKEELEILKIFLKGDKLHLISYRNIIEEIDYFSKEELTHKKVEFCHQTINKNTLSLNKDKSVLFEIAYPIKQKDIPKENIEFLSSEDKSKLLVSRSLLDKSSISLNVFSINEKVKKIWSNNIAYSHDCIILKNNGSIILYNNESYSLLDSSGTQEKINEHFFMRESYSSCSQLIDDKLITCGFFEDKDNELNKFYFKEFDIKKKIFISSKVSEINSKNFEYLFSTKDDEIEASTYRNGNMELIKRQDGGYYVVMENLKAFYLNEYRFWNPKTLSFYQQNSMEDDITMVNGKISPVRTIFNFNDIVIASVNRKGELEWVKNIQKKQAIKLHVFASLFATSVNNNLYLIYNDHIKNLPIEKTKNYTYKAQKGMAILIEFLPSGEANKKEIINHNGLDFAWFKKFKKISKNEILIYKLKKKPFPKNHSLGKVKIVK